MLREPSFPRRIGYVEAIEGVAELGPGSAVGAQKISVEEVQAATGHAEVDEGDRPQIGDRTEVPAVGEQPTLYLSQLKTLDRVELRTDREDRSEHERIHVTPHAGSESVGGSNRRYRPSSQSSSPLS